MVYTFLFVRKGIKNIKWLFNKLRFSIFYKDQFLKMDLKIEIWKKSTDYKITFLYIKLLFRSIKKILDLNFQTFYPI